jgi:hypothetical protein
MSRKACLIPLRLLAVGDATGRPAKSDHYYWRKIELLHPPPPSLVDLPELNPM